MDDCMPSPRCCYSYFQNATAGVGSDEHQEIVQVDDPDSIPTGVKSIDFRNPMPPRAASEAQLLKIDIHCNCIVLQD